MWNSIKQTILFRQQNVRILSNYLAFIFSVINYPLVSLCQTSFKMIYKGGHYFINSTMNNTNAEIFVESGLPGILINESDYSRLFVDSLYQTVDSGYSEIKFQYGSHSVNKIKYGKVFIGDLSYQGSIYIIDKYNKIGIPIHILKNEKDSTASMVRFNFRKKTLDFVGQDSIVKMKKHEYKMIETSPLPIIETVVFLGDTYGHSGSIKGKFIFDLGSSSPLFLFNKNQSVLNFIKENNFKLFPAEDKLGSNIGYGIYAYLCKVGRQTMKNVSIGLTEKIYMNDILGCIGPSLFSKGYVIIDRKNSIIYYE